MRGYVYTCLQPGAPGFKAGRCTRISDTVNRYKTPFGILRIRFFAVDDPVQAERRLFDELHSLGFSERRAGEVHRCSSGKGQQNDILFYTERRLTELYGTPEAHNVGSSDPTEFAGYEPPRHLDAGTACQACKHVYSSAKELRRHLRSGKCRGVDPLTCPTCYKRFASADSKYQHVRRVRCVPSEPAGSSSGTSIMS